MKPPFRSLQVDFSRAVRASIPALLVAAAPLAGEPRVWTSSDGKTVTAELVDATDATVTIRNDAGREFILPHERLSQADREAIQAHLAKKKAEAASVVWPPANAEEAIPAAQFRKLQVADPKKFNSTYAGRVLAIRGQVLEVKEDKMGPNAGFIVTIDTDDKVPIEFKFIKANYDKDLTLLLGPSYNRGRGPYNEDMFRVGVLERSLVVERRYVVSRESYYNDTAETWRYRTKWSDWEVFARPATRGDTVTIRGEFVSVFNSIMSFKDSILTDRGSASVPRSTYNY
jgi:hypothetical protein